MVEVQSVRRAVVAALLAGAMAVGSGGIAAAKPTSAVSPASCTPGYTPCIPNRSSDVDCYGGGGNGPRYTRPGVVYHVVDSKDRYHLDPNHNHRGCE
jgi:hypothetical protein